MDHREILPVIRSGIPIAAIVQGNAIVAQVNTQAAIAPDHVTAQTVVVRGCTDDRDAGPGGAGDPVVATPGFTHLVPVGAALEADPLLQAADHGGAVGAEAELVHAHMVAARTGAGEAKTCIGGGAGEDVPVFRPPTAHLGVRSGDHHAIAGSARSGSQGIRADEIAEDARAAHPALYVDGVRCEAIEDETLDRAVVRVHREARGHGIVTVQFDAQHSVAAGIGGVPNSARLRIAVDEYRACDGR